MITQKKTILIIDEEEGIVKALVARLAEENITARVACDGGEGLQMALDEKPDLILLDILIPKMDGISVLKELRRDPWGKHAQVIMMTNLGEDLERMADASEQRVVEYLVKDEWTLEKLTKKIKEKLGMV